MEQRLDATHFMEISKDNITSTIIESGVHNINLLNISLDLSKMANKKTLFVWKIKQK